MEKNLRAVEVDDETIIHLPGSGPGCWYTLCGMAGADEDNAVNQRTVDVPPDAKVDCIECYRIWQTASKFKRQDFDINE